MDFNHQSVLLDECIAGLNILSEGIYVDGTVGGAGHSLEIVKRLESGRLIGIDRDEAALKAARAKLEEFADKVTLAHSDFRQLSQVLDMLCIDQVDGMLFDFGVSSPQLDEPERGFSYMSVGPLDMRMDASGTLTAYEVINTWPTDRLKKIFYEYGEERYAPAIANAIDRRRKAAPIKTTLELADIIRSAMPAQALREKQHPAKRTFQAVRIAVNDELSAIEELMESACERLKPGGRMAVITFHSLEDRIVKNAMRRLAVGCTCPPDFPKCVCGKTPQARIITKKPMTAGQAELEGNPRARSAKLRILEKL